MVYSHAHIRFPFSSEFLLLFFMLISLSTFYTVLLVAGLRVFSFVWGKEYFGVIFLTGPYGALRKKWHLQAEFSHYGYGKFGSAQISQKNLLVLIAFCS